MQTSMSQSRQWLAKVRSKEGMAFSQKYQRLKDKPFE
jgi:hypothetical protein